MKSPDSGACLAHSPLQLVLVEDDAELRALQAAELAARGVQVTAVGDAPALYRHLAAHPCDIVLLDVGLPGEDGLTIAEHLRASTSLGIIMLTGRGEPASMARGLAGGADLYLVKPVDIEVLMGALEAVRRRLPGAPAGRRFPAPVAVPACWRLQADGWRLLSPQGKVMELVPAERSLLQVLVRNAGEPVGRDDLIAALTDSPWEFDPHRLEVLVHRLRSRARAALGEEPPLRAVRGKGYMWHAGLD